MPRWRGPGVRPPQKWPKFAGLAPHLRAALVFGMIEKFREYSFLLPRYHCERSQSGQG
jgi:hypothetical protein